MRSSATFKQAPWLLTFLFVIGIVYTVMITHGPLRASVVSTTATSQADVQAATEIQAHNDHIRQVPDNQQLNSAYIDQAPSVTERAMDQFDPQAPTKPSVALDLATATTKQPAPLFFSEPRHRIIAGYQATLNLLETLVPQPHESIFLLFTCDGKNETQQPSAWSKRCHDITSRVYQVFSTSPESTRLITILAGTEADWMPNILNEFDLDPDLRVQSVPCLMQWLGRGRTANALSEDGIAEGALLQYVLGSALSSTPTMDRLQPSLHDPSLDALAATKSIATVSSYEAYQHVLATYQAESEPRRPLYVFFISGRREDNDRMWCPSCRFAEIPMEYTFRAYAKATARLLLVEVARSYPEWKEPNAYKFDPALGYLSSVPAFFAVHHDQTGIGLERLVANFESLVALKDMYAYLETNP